MAVRTIVPFRARLVDRVALAFAAVVIGLAAASTDDPSTHTDPRDLDAVAMVIFATALAVTTVSRRFPSGAALGVLGLTLLWYRVGYTSGLVNVAPLVAYYLLGASESRRKVAVTAVSVVVMVVIIGVGSGVWPDAFRASGYLIVAVLFGELVRHRHLLLDQYARRAEQAEADAHRRVVEERLRIARDLHDVLAHSVSAMIVQAGVAADQIDADPPAARDALASIRATGRQAMGEVRATVSVLRQGTGDDTAAGRAPTPRLAQVTDLVAAARERGLTVAVDLDVRSRTLPEVVELTTYRIVQEGLTNIVRHAAASSAVVTIRHAGRELTVEIRDDGRGADRAPEPGFGLRGMAERVESIGGRLWHGPGPAGGWVVRASLPLPGGNGS